MARARRRAKKATKKKAKRRPSRPRAPQSLLAGRPRVYWSPRGGQGKKKNPAGEQEGDYSILAAQDSHGWHWWASDEAGRTMAAASIKPEKDEESALRAAKRAIKKYEARVYPARGVKPAKKAGARGAKRTRLPSILTRI